MGYAEETEAAHFAWWCEESLKHSVDRFAGLPLVLERWQRDWADELLAFDPDADFDAPYWKSIALVVARKNGKALALDTPIPVPDGWTTMGDLEEGDVLFDENGDQCSVTFATPVQYGRDCFRVEFSDKTSIVADAEHQWTVDDRVCGRRTLTTSGMLDAGILSGSRDTHQDRRFSIPVAGSLEIDEIDLAIDPYVLGAWLGDGSSASGRITFGEAFVMEEIERAGYAIGPSCEAPERTAATCTVYGLVTELRAERVLGNKHVPSDYLRSSVPQRLALMQGLMDTDGYISTAGQCEFTTTSMRLASDFMELARTLGFKPSVKHGRATISGRDCGPKWRIQFWAFSDTPVFRMPRKFLRQKDRPARTPRSRTRKIVAIVPVDSVPVKCITVDSPSSLYLAGEGMIPTHNTALLAALALYRLLEGDGKPEVLLAASNDKQAGRLFDACIDYLRQNPELDARVHRREHIGEIVNVESGGKIIRLTSTGAALDGANPSLAICDELHAWDTPTRQRVWTSLRTAAGARKKFQIVTITTAGDAASRASSILGRMIDGNESSGELEKPNDGLTISRNHASRVLVYNYSAPTKDPTDFVAMKLANPASWIDEGFIASQAAADDLTDSDVLQLHGCVWAETSTTFVSPDALKLAQHRFEPVDDGETGVLGFDGSEKRDETWLVFCTTDGRIMPLRRWARPKGDDEWRVPRPEVHLAIDDAMERFNVLELAFDPPGWYSEGDEWASKYGDIVVMFDTNKPVRFAPACERTQTGMLEGDASFGGDLGSVLEVHFANCVARQTASGMVVHKDHPDSPRKIDGAVASIIAFDRAMWHQANHVEPLIAWSFV